MKQRILLLLLLLPMLGLGACQTLAPRGDATVLYFQERDPQGPLYRTRMIVTPAYMRIDDGHDRGGFLLFDRRQRTIYSVNDMDRRILVIRPRSVTVKPPEVFRQSVKRDPRTYPAIAGIPVVHYELFTNGRRCYDVYAARGLLPDVVAAREEFRQVLAGEQAATLNAVPPGMESVCDLADQVFLPTRQFAYGFPVREQEVSGRMRQLLDYQTGVEVSPGLFTLPAGYTRFTVEDMRGSAP